MWSYPRREAERAEGLSATDNLHKSIAKQDLGFYHGIREYSGHLIEFWQPKLKHSQQGPFQVGGWQLAVQRVNSKGVWDGQVEAEYEQRRKDGCLCDFTLSS